MFIYIPILGAIALASGTIFEKIILRKKEIDIKKYQTLSFLSIILVMLPFIYFFWKTTPEALETKNIIIFGLVIISSIIANLFTFYSMKWEKVSNIQPARILEPLFIVLLAITFSFFVSENLYERNLKIIIPALIAGIALVFANLKKDQISINKYILSAVLGSFFFALELVISRLILDFYSPVSFYFLRCSAIFFISLIIFRPKLRNTNKKTLLIILLTGLIWFVYRVVIYYGYLNYGVIFTTLMIMLGPIFIYLFAYKFLKEKLNWKNIIASIIILLCVLYTLLI
jgi:drug/metabolite transporter (DMT)-like permease